MQPFDFFIPSNKPEKAKQLAHTFPFEVRIFDGTGYPSYARLWNDCVRASGKDIVIICGDKAKPSSRDVEKLLSLLDEGYGSVQMHCLGFHGFYKDLINRIGWMDERYEGGGGEHPDFLLRHKEKNYSLLRIIGGDVRTESWDVGER